MDIYKFKWTQLQMEIFKLLCIKSGQIMSGREIANFLKKSPTAVSKSLHGLEKEQLIKINRSRGNFFSIELNLDNEIVINLKRVENLKSLYESGLVQFLRNSFAGGTIILFGSYSNGQDINESSIEGHKSDIDLAVIGVKEKEINLTNYETLLQRKIIINFYASFKDIHRHLKNNILNGIVLSGSVDL